MARNYLDLIDVDFPDAKIPRNKEEIVHSPRYATKKEISLRNKRCDDFFRYQPLPKNYKTE